MHRVLLVLVLLGAVEAEAQAQNPTEVARVVPRLRAAALQGPIHVDGRLDEPAWQAAEPATGFTQLDPHEGEPASERTEVRVLVGDGSLYVGVRLFDAEPGRIRAQLARRDEASDSDAFTISIDSYHDHLTAFSFMVNPAGALRDYAIDSAGNEDDTWDAVWSAQAHVDTEGWTCEIAIPLSQLRYAALDDCEWGVQLVRFIHRKQETDLFAFSPKKETSGVERYGLLVGLGALSAPHRLELLPYALGRSEHTAVAHGDPFRDGSDQDVEAGVDLKYGVTSNLTLNATVNPDFGQVEVDPAVVNLSAFETFFDERRPFFIEGADVFRFGGTRTYNAVGLFRAFHSRRIGRTPQRTLSSADYRSIDAPQQTTIATAAKLTGKPGGVWSVGMLDAVTVPEEARFVDLDGVRGRTDVEPLTNDLVGRVRRDLRGGNTNVGALLTATNRRLEEPALASQLRSSAYLGGFDWKHAWADRHWAFDGFVAGSSVYGSAAAIAATQRSSSRYFQRPDAHHVEFDATRTHLNGWASDLCLAKVAGDHWLGSILTQVADPGFEVNDLGFQTRDDRGSLSTLALYKEDRPNRLLRSSNAYVYENHSWNFDGDNIFGQLSASGSMAFVNYWDANWRLELNPRYADDQLTRGGPLAESPAAGRLTLGCTTDSRRRLQGNTSVSFMRNEADGFDLYYSAGLNVRPSPGVQLRFSPELDRSRDRAQYLDTIDDTLASVTFGNRYVFATIDQTTLSFTTRLDWTLSPKLSLQLYVQPLVGSGKYFDYEELRRPRAYEFDVYGHDRGTIAPTGTGQFRIDPDGAGPAPNFTVAVPDFNFRSLRGNAVLRWEYRPGSALFLVWQQNRAGTESFGDFDFGRDARGLVDQRPDNVFVLKTTYWFGS